MLYLNIGARRSRVVLRLKQRFACELLRVITIIMINMIIIVVITRMLSKTKTKGSTIIGNRLSFVSQKRLQMETLSKFAFGLSPISF